MSRAVWFTKDPFLDVGSDLTSETIGIPDAIAWSAIVGNDGGSSVVTAQVSNWTGSNAGAAPEISFASNYTAAEAEVIVGDPGFKFVRFLRTNSDVSVDLNKMVG